MATRPPSTDDGEADAWLRSSAASARRTSRPSVRRSTRAGPSDPYWAPYFDKLPPAREWIAEVDPDVCIVVYNDHANAFSLELIPTFALGLADRFEIADEGFGPRPVPAVDGHPELAWHLAESLILDEFDMTLVNEMKVDHGLTVPLSVMFGEPDAWPCKVIPLAVNVVQYPPPTGNRCYRLGQAIRRAVESYEGNERVVIFGTGGLSHQLQAERAGLDQRRVGLPVPRPDRRRPRGRHQDHAPRVHARAGSEGIELVMWLIMRGAMTPHGAGDLPRHARPDIEHPQRSADAGERLTGHAARADVQPSVVAASRRSIGRGSRRPGEPRCERSRRSLRRGAR